MNQAPDNLSVVETQAVHYPRCGRCHKEVKTIKYLDYGDIRLVYHADEGKGTGEDCVLGVINAE